MTRDILTNALGQAQFNSLPLDGADEFKAPSAWPTLQPAALVGFAGDFVRAATANSEADEAAVLLTLLTATGAAVGPDCHSWVSDTKHYARLYTLIVGS